MTRLRTLFVALLALVLPCLPAHATVYMLCNKVTATQSAPASGVIPQGSQVANLSAGGALSQAQAPTNQTFQIVVTTTSGNGSATVQPFVSNDGFNWVAYGSTLVVASGASPAQISGTGTAAWAYFTAQVTAIAGTGASVTCSMNA